MSSKPDLSAVGRRLEEAVDYLATVRPEDDRLELYEEAAIAILDSEHSEFPDKVLENYLKNYLRNLNQ